MSIILDHQLREKIHHDDSAFHISYFHDELATLLDRTSPLHWHPDFEIATAVSGVLDFQVGNQHIELEAGDSIFVNKNVLHRIKQLSGDVPDPMPNVVFSDTVIAAETSVIHKKYIYPVECCNTLPFIVFEHKNDSHRAELISIFEYIFLNFERFTGSETARVNINAQVRLQKMLSYIHENYNGSVTLEDIAGAADISSSEAGRCFNAYMGCSPVDALIRYRLLIARRLLADETLTLQEISDRCGFHSVNYFSRRFRRLYGCTPSRARLLGK